MAATGAAMRINDRPEADRLAGLRRALAVATLRPQAQATREVLEALLRTGFALLAAASRLLPEVSGELSGRFSVAAITKPLVAPIVRAALRHSMQMLGEAFIVGESIEQALARGKRNAGLALCSFDVLG